MKAFAMMRGHIPLEKMIRCKHAAYYYMGAKAAIAILTFFFIPCESCQNHFSYILRTVLHITIIGHLIAMGLRVLMTIISLSYTLKASFFFANFFMAVDLDFTLPVMGSSWQIMDSSAVFNYALIVNAVISIFVVFMMVRAIQELRILKKEREIHGT